MTEPRPANPADASSASVCTVDAFRLRAKRLLADPTAFVEGAHPGDFDLNPDVEAKLLGAARALIPAAVLVPIVMRSHLSVLLTVRTGHLPQHAGQIAFPGGRIEDNDGGALRAALREAKEESASIRRSSSRSAF